jgi:cobalt-zinc-cadmium efflux system outer membrane protein
LLKRSRLLVLAQLVATVVIAPSGAEEKEPHRYVLTLDQARELARAQSPRLTASRARIDVARGERVGAGVWQPTNPELAVAAGPRERDGEDLGTDLEVEIGQTFELGGRRGARIEHADAGISRATSVAHDAERIVLLEVSRSFLSLLHAERSLEVARESARVAGELRAITERRFETGDVGILDPYAAATADGRARIRVAELEASRALVLAELRTLLALEEDAVIVPEGDLADRGRYELEALRGRAADRADLIAIEAEIAQARADERLGKGYRAPDLGAFARYSREEEADIAMGGLVFTLPFLERGQGRSAVAAAERRALETELSASRTAVDREVRARYMAFSVLDATSARFGEETLPRLDRMLDLARQSYEAGNSPFTELLVLQREVVEARQAYLDLLLEAALAGTELEAAAGVM